MTIVVSPRLMLLEVVVMVRVTLQLVSTVAAPMIIRAIAAPMIFKIIAFIDDSFFSHRGLLFSPTDCTDFTDYSWLLFFRSQINQIYQM